MNWLKKLLLLFKRKKEDENPDAEVTEVLPEKKPFFPDENNMILNPEEVEMPYWLANEDALKDEGVIFGLSDTQLDEKLQVISSFFTKISSEFLQKKEELNEKIGELNLQIEKKHLQLENLKEKAEKVLTSEKAEENILRVTVGLILSIGMAAGNYFIIDHALSKGFETNHQFIAWGVFLTGMFNLYGLSSVIHNEDRLTWKKVVEEFGMPLAASLFVLAFTIPYVSPFQSVAYFVFTFLGFLVSGKLFLGNLTKIKSEWRNFVFNRNINSDLNKIESDWKEETEQLETEIEKLRVEKWKIIPELNKMESELDRIKADQQAIENIFLSEYNLAKNYKNKLSGNQLKKIMGD